MTKAVELVRRLVGQAGELQVGPPALAGQRDTAAAQGVWVPTKGWSRAMATACCWVSPEPAWNA